jgi:hypothetical protein
MAASLGNLRRAANSKLARPLEFGIFSGDPRAAGLGWKTGCHSRDSAYFLSPTIPKMERPLHCPPDPFGIDSANEVGPRLTK